MPCVSVIMPVYQAEAYLKQALDSVLAQDFRDFELICVDDGSTDGSPEILRSYAAKDPRVRVMTQRNLSAGAARNRGFDACTGEYVLFLDSDDVFMHDLIRRALKRARKTGADVTAFLFHRFTPEGVITPLEGFHRELLPDGAKVFSYIDCPDKIMSVITPVPWNKLFRADFLRENHLRFDEITSSNDLTFAALTSVTAERIAFLRTDLAAYRVGHEGTITSTKPRKLNNVALALDSTIRQVRALPQCEQVLYALRSFVFRQIRFSAERYIKDVKDEGAADFCRYAHELFNGELFQGVDEDRLFQEERHKLEFRLVRDLSYEEFLKLSDDERLARISPGGEGAKPDPAPERQSFLKRVWIHLRWMNDRRIMNRVRSETVSCSGADPLG